MQKKLNIQWFIEQHSDWEDILSKEPYCLQISRENWNDMKLIMFKYSQVYSDFNEPICRECRGLILNEDTLEPISFPFYKFGNVSEGSWVEKIDWNDNPYVLEKCDGSLIKIVKVNGKLLISTNGTILASTAPIAEQIGCESKTFQDLLYWALRKQFPSFNDTWFEGLFEEGYTYMFELCTIFNRVVVVHNIPKVYFIGIRNNSTFEETYIMDHPLSNVFPTPKVYSFGTFEECVSTAKALPWDSEGYVITDRSFKRNKAKSLGYLSCHHMKNNGVLSYERGIEIVRGNELAEVIAYFPEFKEHLERIRDDYDKLHVDLINSWKSYGDNTFETRKDSAIWIQKNFRIPGVGFSLIDKKVSSVDEWMINCPTRNLAKYLGYKD